jgi:hypothetical protein
LFFYSPAEKPAEKNISLLLPDLFVAGSARASFSVLGQYLKDIQQGFNNAIIV